MMKRGFSTVAFANLDYKDIIDAAVRNGMDGVEIRLDSQNNLFGHPAEDTEMIGNAFREAGIGISDIGTSVCIKDYNEAQVATYKKCLDVAKMINAKGARVFLANFLGKFTQVAPYDYDGIVKALKEACAYGEEVGVEVWVETHNEFSCGSVLAKLHEDVGSKNLKFIWDLIHPIERYESAEDTMRYMGDKIAHIHVKDGRKKTDKNEINYLYTKLGEGDVPVGEMLALLRDAGFDGYLSLEWEAAWRTEIKTTYTTPDALLGAYNAYLDSIEKNILPPISSDEWTTFTPDLKPLARFKKSEYNVSLDISLASESYGVGKWVAEVEAAPGWYDLSVSCESASLPNDLYVIYTTIRKEPDEFGSNWSIRDHAEKCEMRDGRYYFTDKIEIDDSCDKVRIELWLKGKRCDVRWFAPSLIPAEAPKPRMVRVANAFLDRLKGRTLEWNKERILATIDRSAAVKPDVITLSECMYHFGTGVSGIDAGLTVNDPFIEQIKAKAREYNCYIIFNLSLKEGIEYYNASLLIDRSGKIAAIQKKTHLTVTELDRGMSPGEGYEVFETDFGKIGIQICWDHYFSAPEEALNEKGAEIVFVSSIGDANEKSIARAMDSGVHYVICGHHQENAHGWGPSRIIAPDGEILGHSDDENEVVWADIDLNKKLRRKWLSLGPAESSLKSTYKYERHHID